MCAPRRGAHHCAHHGRPPLTLAARALSAPIHAYRRYISPLKPPSCRFAPTCSQYALDAYREWGALKGTWLTLARLARCHPWHPGGHDPVPPARTDAPPEP
ncbi:MAG: membrane protein insertion efficiency factor YidD [Deltaproteobacteria bacterium]|nr:membrane protein insertion efficiency factor YidD [Deltaproteobacteria bacterium]